MTTKPADAPTWTSTVHEVFPHQETGLACLVVQSNEDRDKHLSEINACDDFTTGDPETVWSAKLWIYSMWLASDDEVYVAHSGKILRRGPLDAPEPVLTHNQDVTRLCGARQGVYLVGLNGYVGHFDGESLHDFPVPNAEVYCVAEAANETLWAAGSQGQVFRRVDQVWEAIQVADTGDVRFIIAHGDAMLFAGANGLCGRIDGTTVTRFKVPADREFFALAVFGDRVYVGAGRNGLDVVEDDCVVSFKDNVYSFYLFANNDYLCVGGLSEAARFDGDSWLATEFTPGQ